MPAQKTITLSFPNYADNRLTHQVRNLAEDLWREIEKPGLGDVGGLETVDRAVDTLIIRINHTRNIGRVRKLVDDLLSAHLLTQHAETDFS